MKQFVCLTRCLFPALLWACSPGLAASPEMGRLFYTPAQRAQLESARTHHVTHRSSTTSRTEPAPAPIRYDGLVIRSDGHTTRWVDGKAQVGATSVPGLKPGQIRADGKVYEPYQVLPPLSQGAAESTPKESTP